MSQRPVSQGPVLRGTIAAALALLLVPGAAAAYVGPGAGLTAIGTVLALIGAVCLAIVGFVWYPVKRLLRGSASSNNSPEGRTPDEWSGK